MHLKMMLKHVLICPLTQQHQMYLKRSKMGYFYGELCCFVLFFDFYLMGDCSSGRVCYINSRVELPRQ